MLSKEMCVMLRDWINQSVKTSSRTQSMNFWPLDLVHMLFYFCEYPAIQVQSVHIKFVGNNL